MIFVFGANGLVGSRACAALDEWRVPFTRVVRPSMAFAGATVVLNCAAPLRETAAPVLVAAMAAGAHYVDVGGEQGALQALYERHESTVRRAGLVALPGAGVDGTIGDLAARWAAEFLCGGVDEGPIVRAEPAARLAEDEPLDELATAYVFDELALSAGTQRALFGQVGERPLVWCRDRWEPGRAGDHRVVNAGAQLGGARDALAFAGGDPLALPRHLAANHVASYVSLTRSPAASGALRLLARALPFAPKRAADLLAPYAPPDADYARTRLAVIAQARRGFSSAQLAVRGRDLYRSTAIVAAWCARALADRGPGPTGMRAPGELFRAAPALRDISLHAGFAIEPGFG